MSKLASLILKITADGAMAEKELRTLEGSIDKFIGKLKNVGTTLTRTVTLPLVALGTASVAAANKQEQAEARLLNALRGREDIQQRLIASASELQARSTLGDEVVIEQQAFLAALGLSEEQINSTIEAAAQLSAALGMDMNSAVRNLAKTYSGLAGELGESIPALRNLTAEEMKAGGAIKYVNDNYKGFAETAAQTGTGSLMQLKNSLGDVAEKIGQALLPAINSLVDKLMVFADWLNKLDAETVKWGVSIAAVVAALGPAIRLILSLGNGIAKIVGFIPTVVSGFTKLKTLFSGIAGLKAGIVGVFAAVAVNIFNATRRAKEFSRELDEIKRKGVQSRADEMYDLQYTLYNKPGVSDAEIQAALDEMKAQLNRDAAYYISASGGRLTERQVDELGVIRAGIRALEEIQAIRRQEVQSQAALNDETEKTVGLIPQLQAKVQSLNEALNLATTEDEIRRINGELAKTQEELKRLQELQPKKIFDMTPVATSSADISKLTAAPMLKSTGGPKKSLFGNLWASYIDEEAEAAEKKAAEMAERMKRVGEVLSNTIAEVAISIGESLGNLFAGEMTNPLKGLLKVLAEALKQLGTALITYSSLVQTVKSALAGGNVVVSITAGIAAIAAGVALSKYAETPVKMAKGGLAFAPTLAIVGDNKGASFDPEVVAPLSKLRQYMGGQKLELVGGVEFVLRGDTARAVLNRENVRLSRLG